MRYILIITILSPAFLWGQGIQDTTVYEVQADSAWIYVRQTTYFPDGRYDRDEKKLPRQALREYYKRRKEAAQQYLRYDAIIKKLNPPQQKE